MQPPVRGRDPYAHRRWATTTKPSTASTDGKDHTDIDLAIAIEHLCLAATTLGLQTCWVCNFNAAEAARILGLGETEEVVALIPIGFPAEEEPAKKRKSLSDILRR